MIADALASTLASTTVADAPINFSVYVQLRPLSLSPFSGWFADALASTLGCTIAMDALINYSNMFRELRLIH